MHRKTFLTALVAGGLVAATPNATPPHFALAKSSPEAGAMAHEVTSVTLWFTEAAQAGSVTIRILDGAEEAVASSDPVEVEGESHAFRVTPRQPLATGTYTVAWRGMGADGHVVRDTFSFMVGHGDG